MAKDYAKSFYNSATWRKCKDGFMQSKHYLCERCGDIAVICHHKRYITPQNINNPNITLNWDNLEALCQTCHNQEHHSSEICANGLAFDSKGNLIQK
ncbi:HNH endonuclease [Bacillus bombysepticus]|uniref:HNH endonuclease n=1 Tax=Bacillus thuringiensis serovar kumamotoensis TaxID=132267 RepID=A0A9X6PPF4_BACUK|nr:HNH endonuclease [Bacillus thuringiensis]MEC2868909.1 HNH endonuclease [Bacillus cereus]OTZ69272.1 HNH endonuclease [Bacillus thuringiensis serovar kumamtoensis]PEY30461.1 HNH endonuclease [Bacillus cereus]